MRSILPPTFANPRILIPTTLLLAIIAYALLDTFLFETPTLAPITSYLPSFTTTSAPPHTYLPILNTDQTAEQRQNDRHLTRSQCLATYPRLYEEADRAAKFYRGKKGISLEDVDEAEKVNAAARVVILNNQLYVRNYYGGINSRAQAAIAALYRTVISSPEPLPDVDIVLQVNDAGDGNLPVFALCRKESQPGLWLMPDFGFYAWPEPMGSGAGSYDEIRSKALEREMLIAGNVTVVSNPGTGSKFGSDVEEVGREGTPLGSTSDDQPDSESDFREIFDRRTLPSSRSNVISSRRANRSLGSGVAAEADSEANRAAREGEFEEGEAIEQADAAIVGVDGIEMGAIVDVQPQSWKGKIGKLFWRGVPMVDIRQQLFRASEDRHWSDVADVNWGNIAEGKYTTMADHCDYKYLAHVEGWAYSGRLKYIQMCRSVIVTHPLQYIQHYHHLFNTDPNCPTQNMVEVATPLEDHLPEAMEALLMDQERAELIAANSWREFREGYISPAANECYFRYLIAAYASVQTFQPTLDGAVSYESFVLTGRTSWEPHR